jgi:ABC-type multidrug transport system permease subunit
LNSAEWWWRVYSTAQFGAREHRAAEPWRINLVTRWPRAVLMCLFFTFIGKAFGGDERQQYTFIGSIAIIISLFTLAQITNTPLRDRWSATFYRLRTARLPVTLIYVIRVWPVVAEAIACSALCILIVGFGTGQGELVTDLMGVFWIYVLIILTSTATGLALASVGLFGRAGDDLIVANLGIFLTIAASGAMIEPGRVAWLDAIGAVLPMRNGLQAIHAHLAGDPWHSFILKEIAVGIGWAILGIAAYALLTRRVRMTDHDKVT